MITEQQRHIDLHLPKSWPGCSTDELEQIAAIIVRRQLEATRFRPFSWEAMKVEFLMAANRLEVVQTPFGDGDRTDPSYMVQQYDGDGEKVGEPFPMSAGQVHAIITSHLAWLDAKDPAPIVQFPYPTLDVRCKMEDGRAISHHPSSIVHLQGPPPLMDGYSWQDYRWLTDWMQAYMRHANVLAQVKSGEVRERSVAAMEQARCEFLAILFKPAEKPTGTGAAEHTSSISHLTSDIFTDFSPVKWQVILFWWSSLMRILQQKFPRVFKQQPVGKGKKAQKKDTPWDFYNHVTATLQKEYRLSETEQNRETYSVTLQKLDNMAAEAEEMKKLKMKK